MMQWTFGRKIGLGFAVAAIALFVIALTGYRSITTLVEADEWVAHTHEVRAQVSSLFVQVLNLETSQRGYLITGKDEYLEPYRTALPEVDREYGELRRLTLDNPTQQRNLDELHGLLDTRRERLKAALDAPTFDAAKALISSDASKVAMDRLRVVLAELDAEEARLLEARRHDAQAGAQLATAIIEWGSVAAIVLTLIVGWLLASSLSRQIAGAVRNVQSSSTELQAAANQQASSAREQATAMTEIATTMSELLATSRQIADSSQRVSQIAAQTAVAARAGDAQIAAGTEASALARKQTDVVVGHMLELGKKSQQVGSVLDIVAELAEQTNILAINATIEAAGAGEAGRRFGVVADEIRKLADRVGASTKEIRGMVDDVRDAVHRTVMATEAGSKAVDAGALQVAETATSFREIASLVGTTTEAAREIELSTKQQATAVEQVNVAITNVAQATRETEASASQTLQTSAQLTALSADLMAIVQSQAEPLSPRDADRAAADRRNRAG